MEVRKIEISKIKQIKNSRTLVKQHHLETLMASLKQDGLLQPIGVRPIENTDEFEVNFGNRRLIAAQKLGWHQIDCNILTQNESESDSLITNLVENEHRSNISDLDRGRYYLELLSDKYGLTKRELAVRVGVSIKKIEQCIRLHKNIPEDLRKKVKKSASNKHIDGSIPISLADTVVTKAKILNFSKSDVAKLLNYCREPDVSKPILTATMQLMQAGATFEKAKKKTHNVKSLTITIPITKDDYQFYLNEYGTTHKIREAICKSLYGLSDSEVTFEKPY